MAKKKRLTHPEARALLEAEGIDFTKDVDATISSMSKANRVAEIAKLAGYRKRKDAPGSTSRMYFQFLSRLHPMKLITDPRRSERSTRAAATRRVNRERDDWDVGHRHHTTKKSPAQLQRDIDSVLASKRNSKACANCDGKGRTTGCRNCGVMSGRRGEVVHLKKPASGPKLQYDDSEIERMFKKGGSKGTLGDHDKTVIAVLGDPMYVRRFKMPKWNVQPTVLTTPDVAIKHWNTLGIPTSKSAHQQKADYLRELRNRFDAEHSRLINEGQRAYGKNGSLISGGFREDWPAAIKDRIRFVAQGSSVLADAIRLHDALSKTRSSAFHW